MKQKTFSVGFDHLDMECICTVSNIPLNLPLIAKLCLSSLVSCLRISYFKQENKSFDLALR